MATIGDPAPDFSLIDQHGDTVALADLRGHRTLVFFYPKANTPGCTTQACGLRDIAGDIGDVTILGISPDTCLLYTSEVPDRSSSVWAINPGRRPLRGAPSLMQKPARRSLRPPTMGCSERRFGFPKAFGRTCRRLGTKGHGY